jgi:hypothetical protein
VLGLAQEMAEQLTAVTTDHRAFEHVAALHIEALAAYVDSVNSPTLSTAAVGDPALG